MRKRRSTVYVSPGKDVTLYVPADTPQAVIDYLNRLKDEGQFSQGVMDILIQHVAGSGGQQLSSAEQPVPLLESLSTPAVDFTDSLSSPVEPDSNVPSAAEYVAQASPATGSPVPSESLVQSAPIVESSSTVASDSTAPLGSLVSSGSPAQSQSDSAGQSAPVPFHLRMADIFRQAQKNSGKLVDIRADSTTD